MNNRWMKIASRGALMAVMFFVFAAPSCQSSPVDGVWNVTGTDAQLGDYTGQVEFYHEGQTLKFARSVQYTNQAFKDYDVYTGWDGTAVSGESDTTATVALRTVDYIKQAEGLARDGSRTDDELVTGVFVSTGKNTMSATYTSAPVGDVSATETLTYVGPSGETPIFKMDDTYYASHNEMPSGIRNIIWNQLTEYHQLEYYDGYRDRPEFQAGIHFFPHFRTDFAWYRAHPDALRVPNKTVDGISLTETMLRARSFGPTLAEKAALFDADVQEYDISPVGMIADYVYGTEPKQWEGNHDSSLWTGVYVAGQFYRYAVTGEAEALANAVNSLQGMLALMDVTGDPAEFARTVRVHREGTVPGVPGAYNKWNQGAEGYADMDWECCGNNDMVAGIFYSFAVAWTMLPDDAAYDDERARMADQSERLVALLNVTDDKDLGSDSNKVTANGLAYALTGKPEYLTAYNENFSDGLELILQAGGGMLYEWGISDWSGQHLTTIDLYSRYLASVLVDDVERLPLYATGWSTGMGLTKDVRYTLWPFVAYGTSEPESKHDEVLEEAIWTMREVPFPKEQFYIDPRVDPDYCVSPLPSLFWKLDWMDGGRHQGLYAKPIFQRGAATAYYWKDNPLAVDQTPGSIKDPSADYTHAYWMGRYFGIYDETE